MIEFAKAPVTKVTEVIITDVMYESIVDDLISAGKILMNCKHVDRDNPLAPGPCKLCVAAWEGCVDNANKVRSGKSVLKKRKR